MSRVPAVRVVKIGTVSCEPTELASTLTQQIKSDLGIGGGPTVVLIEAGRRVLVDTGFDYEWLDTPDNDERNATTLASSLGYFGLMTEDIDVVFITHWHKDHFGNVGIFHRAERLASKGMVERIGLHNHTKIDDEEEIGHGVKVMLTPRHTIDHASIIVDAEPGGIKARIVIAGDAVISHSYLQSGRIWQHNADFYDLEVARESILRLVGASDIIIPGHGSPFTIHRPR